MFGYIMFLRECSSPRVVTNHTTDTVIYRDSIYIPKLDTLYFTDTIYKDSVISRIIEREKIDTVYIIREHFTYSTYKDTILNDSNGLIVISDTLYRNKIKSRYNQIKLYPQRFKPTLRNKLFLGFGVGGWIDRFSLQGSVGLLTKRDNLYTISYDPINKDVSLGMYWKLKINK